MRKMNRVLGQRIKQLEVQNFHMTSQGFNKMSGMKHQEPSRPIFSGGFDAAESPRRINSYGPSRAEGAYETPAHNQEGQHMMPGFEGDTNNYD